MLRTLTVLLLCGLVACGTDETASTDDTDAVVDDGTHPLVPDEFKALWNTEGSCKTEFGDGDQMYMIFEGRVEADGTLTGTERVWWFYADEPESKDCVDTFALSGVALAGEPAALGCTSCEEFYQTRRTLTEDTCRQRYNRVYREDDDGLYQRLMFDTLNEFNDQPNEDDKIGVFHEEKDFFSSGYVTKLYAAETGSKIIPDGEVFGPPATYKWIGRRCQVTWGGGGG
jgi:hypothetical protein